MRTTIVAASLFFITMCTQASATCPGYVAGFVPQVFQGQNSPVRELCQDISTDSATLMAVLFSNGRGGRIVLLQAGANGAAKLLSAPNENMGDEPLSLDAQDLNGDGQKELVATFRDARGSGVHNVWVWAVRNQQLTLISPSNKDGGPLTDPTFIDLDSRGSLSLVDRKLDIEPDPDDATGVSRLVTPIFTLYSLQNGSYAKASGAPVLFAASYLRDAGEPTTDDQYFPFSQNGPSTITLLNGRPGHPDEACESGSVLLNGQQVFGQSDFKRQEYVLRSTAQLLPDNTVSVRLTGKPGCHVYLLVRGGN